MNISKETELQHLAAQYKMSLLTNYSNWPMSFIDCSNLANVNIWDSSAGIGILASQLADKCRKLIVTEYTEKNLVILKEKFNKHHNVTVRQCDLTAIDLQLYEQDDIQLIINLDVLEHIENDEQVLIDFYKLLQRQGKLLVKVPALKSLYCDIDRQSLHFRRYSKVELLEKLLNAGFKVTKISYINMIGALSYFMKGTILNSKINSSNTFSNTFSEAKLNRINKLIPILISLEKLVPSLFGLSLVAVAEKR